MVFFFIPALWQGQNIEPTLFLLKPWDGCDYPASPDITLQYDKLGRLTNMVDASGTNRYAYVNLDLLSEDGPWASDTVIYTNVNRLRKSVTVTNLTGAWTQTYAYDAMKRLTNITSGSGSFGYKFGVQASSLPIRVGLPGSSYITNTYDGNARLLKTQLKNSGNTLLNSHSYGYNAGNQRTNVTHFYTNAWDYLYDGAGQLVSAKGRDGTTNRLHEQFLYKYDEAGNLQTRTNNALVQSFVLNALNQLNNITRNVTNALTVSGVTETNATSVTVNAQAAARYLDRTFAKDGFTPADGNNTFTAVASNAAFTNSNAITAWLPLTQTFAYDLNGNLLSDGRQALSYDDENQLISVLVTNTWKSEFTYDGKMRLRVAKEFTWNPGSGVWVLGTETRYVYDGMLCIQERDGSNVRTITYTRGRDLSGSLEGAGGIGGLLAMTDQRETAPSVATAYYHCDGNGNVTALVNTNQIVVARYAYDPYGNTLSISGPRADVNRYRFSSKEAHLRSGFVYYGYRFYEPNLQRWLNRDPLGEKGFETKKIDFSFRVADGANLYGFVRNMAINEIDSDGLSFFMWPLKALCAAVIGKYTLEEFKSNMRYTHCMASCRIGNTCGADTSFVAGVLKEYYDLAKCLWTGNPDYCSSAFQPEDFTDNFRGLCPPWKSCKDKCKDLENAEEPPPGPFYPYPW